MPVPQSHSESTQAVNPDKPLCQSTHSLNSGTPSKRKRSDDTSPANDFPSGEFDTTAACSSSNTASYAVKKRCVRDRDAVSTRGDVDIEIDIDVETDMGMDNGVDIDIETDMDMANGVDIDIDIDIDNGSGGGQGSDHGSDHDNGNDSDHTSDGSDDSGDDTDDGTDSDSDSGSHSANDNVNDNDGGSGSEASSNTGDYQPVNMEASNSERVPDSVAIPAELGNVSYGDTGVQTDGFPLESEVWIYLLARSGLGSRPPVAFARMMHRLE